MIRYFIGISLIGFVAILAGGFTLGLGVSCASVFAFIALLTLWSIWFGALLNDLVVDRSLFRKLTH